MDLIDESGLVELTRNLIRIPSSVRGLNYGCEENIAKYLYKRLEDSGFEVHLQKVMEGRPNVVGILRGVGGGYNLMLNGHLDTIETEGMEVDPYAGEVRGGRIYGRGAADMKGALAAMVVACEAAKESNVELRGDLIFSGCADEEGRGTGGEYLARSGLKADMAIVGEPTGLNLGIAHKGLTFIEVRTYGKATHGSSPHLGKNAILIMNRVINLLNTKYHARLSNRKHPILGTPTFNIGLIEGGYRPNVVPDSCKMLIDRRIVPGEDYRSVLNELNEVLSELRSEDPEVKFQVEAIDWIKCSPMETSKDELIVKTVRESLKAVSGVEAEVGGLPYWCDAGSISNIMKIPTLIFGPGELEQAHSSTENIKITDLTIYAKTILKTIMDICVMER
ncbi:MAG: M20 family metallopeptidase [Candidatus Bathyarchaeia archaeon]